MRSLPARPQQIARCQPANPGADVRPSDGCEPIDHHVTVVVGFAEETGSTPPQWILRARVDTARELLESTRLSVDRIADQVGLGNGSNLRLYFRRLLDVSPSECRATFSGRS